MSGVPVYTVEDHPDESRGFLPDFLSRHRWTTRRRLGGNRSARAYPLHKTGVYLFYMGKPLKHPTVYREPSLNVRLILAGRHLR